MNIDGISTDVAAKRTFVMRAFAPLGAEVCDGLALPPASQDVIECEEANAVLQQRMVAAVMADKLLTRVRWYVEAKQSSEDNYLIQGRTLEEDLMAFALCLFEPEPMSRVR